MDVLKPVRWDVNFKVVGEDITKVRADLNEESSCFCGPKLCKALVLPNQMSVELLLSLLVFRNF